ncbi:MAG: tetratricopeptide repeat protein [Bacteriovorax sp.]|nr:tetratricopeptide repeat protein [Bacteriovorax sp.]
MENISFAQSIMDQEKASTYLRWNFFTGRDQLQFNKKGNKVVIKTLNNDLYKNLKEELASLKIDQSYIKGINYKESDTEANSASALAIEIELKNDNVEMFSFYRERDKKYVVDFWMDGDTVSLNKAAIKKPIEEDQVVDVTSKPLPIVPVITKAPKTKVKKNQANKPASKEDLVSIVKEDKILSSFIVDPNKVVVKSDKEILAEEVESKKPYRDFRYGATFIWDYDPIAPAYKEVVNLKTKIPEIFYPIANRSFKKSEQEAHLQLTINLYRKKKWGLMYKSIKLFQQKYGMEKEWELVEFIKANAILRENIETPNPELFKNAFSILSTLSEKSENYELKKAIYKYLLTFYMAKGEHLKTLQLSKNYYAGTRDNFDFEESAIPAEAMLNSLAKLGQIEKIQELSQEKSMKKILPAQLILSYQTFSYLRSGDLTSLIALYEKNKASLAKPIDPVIMYNTAEAYFRVGRYNESMALYEDFVKNYSHEFVASNASLRIALCSDLMDRNYQDTLELYKRAIDQSVDSNVSYEARIRYVAFRGVRKIALDDRDLEIRIFLEQDKNLKTIPDKNLSKLLQQVRLRSLIVDGKYKEALAYLSLLPMVTMPKIDARVFDGDGAEIIYGIISDFYKKSEYSQVIKAWQTYKDKYVDKVAQDPFINFVVGSSYVKLGLYKGFDEVYASFEKLKDTPNRTFPIWIARGSFQKASDLLSELVLIKDIKLQNWDLVQKNIAVFGKRMTNYNKTNYYRGLVAFNQKNYPEAVTQFENFFSKQDQRIIYDPSDVADMIRAYTDSIYELGQTDKFLKVSEAILNDTNSFGTDNAYIQNVRERIAYLGIEITAGFGKKENYMLFEKKITDFKKANPRSIYTGRVNYLLGQAMIINQKVKEGRDVFTSLMNDKNTSDYIKELAKSELSLLNLKEKTL